MCVSVYLCICVGVIGALRCAYADIGCLVFLCGCVDVLYFYRKCHTFLNINSRNLHLRSSLCVSVQVCMNKCINKERNQEREAKKISLNLTEPEKVESTQQQDPILVAHPF